MANCGRRTHDAAVAQHQHRPLCTIELIAEGHASRCPGERCAFWDDGCVLSRIEEELDGRPDVAALLLDLRRKLGAGGTVHVDEVSAAFRRHLADES